MRACCFLMLYVERMDRKPLMEPASAISMKIKQKVTFDFFSSFKG